MALSQLLNKLLTFAEIGLNNVLVCLYGIPCEVLVHDAPVRNSYSLYCVLMIVMIQCTDNIRINIARLNCMAINCRQSNAETIDKNY